MKFRVLSFLIGFFLASAFAHSTVATEIESVIRMKSEVVVSEAKMLTLADVALFENIDESLLKNVKSTRIGMAPQLGEKHSYTSVFLSSLLRKALDEIPFEQRENWSIRIPSKVTISNQGHRISSEAIEERLGSHWRNLCSECKFVVMNLIAPQIPAALQKYAWELRLTDNLPRGQFSVGLEVRDDGGQPHLFWVKGQVQIQQQIPVTLRAINFGERLSRQDFSLQWKDVTFSYDSAANAEALVGKRVSRSLRNGEPIFSGMIEKEKALKRGDLVKVVLSEDNWSIVMSGIAEQDGFIGDTVRVRNEKSKKQISGIVTAEGEVIVR